MTSAISQLMTNSTSTPAAAPANARNDQLGQDAFLKLLVTQLRYQDPLSPSDPGAFLAQTAQFTTVEKLDQLTKQGDITTRALGLSAASGLIGRSVSWIGEDGTTLSGRVGAASSSIEGVRLTVGDAKVPLEAVTGIS